MISDHNFGDRGERLPRGERGMPGRIESLFVMEGDYGTPISSSDIAIHGTRFWNVYFLNDVAFPHLILESQLIFHIPQCKYLLFAFAQNNFRS